MKYLVTKDFTDKHTAERYKAGAVIELSEERADEILATCEVVLPLDALIAEHMASEEPAAEEPVAEEPVAEEPVAEEAEQPKPAARRSRAKKGADAK